MKEETEESTSLSHGDFMSSFLTRHHPPAESVAHFQSVPWLNKYLSSPKYKIIPTFSRHLKSSGEDYFFSRTINTPSTIPHMISLQLSDLKTPEPIPTTASTSDSSSHRTPTNVPENPDAVMLLSLGSPGLDGHPSVIHGGMSCAILDETMGLLVMLHDNNIRGPGPRDSLFTANLNVSYRAPVPTPSNLIVKTWLVSRQGRKWRSKGQIVDEDGKVLAEADGLWVVARRDKI